MTNEIKLPGVFHQRALIETRELIARQQYRLAKQIIKLKADPSADTEALKKLEQRKDDYTNAGYSINFRIEPGQLHTMTFFAVRDDKLIQLDTVNVRTQVILAYLERHKVSIQRLQGDLTKAELLQQLYLLYDWQPTKHAEGIHCVRVRHHKTLAELQADNVNNLLREEAREMIETWNESQDEPLTSQEKAAVRAMPFA